MTAPTRGPSRDEVCAVLSERVPHSAVEDHVDRRAAHLLVTTMLGEYDYGPPLYVGPFHPDGSAAGPYVYVGDESGDGPSHGCRTAGEVGDACLRLMGLPVPAERVERHADGSLTLRRDPDDPLAEVLEVPARYAPFVDVDRFLDRRRRRVGVALLLEVDETTTDDDVFVALGALAGDRQGPVGWRFVRCDVHPDAVALFPDEET